MLWYIYEFLSKSGTTIFWISAISGTTLFALRVVMTIFGGVLDVDDAELDSFDGDSEFHHNTPSFKLLSLHSMSGFFMMFGWVGLACTAQLQFSYFNALLCAFCAGLTVMVITAFIFRAASYLEGTGSVFSIQKTMGLVGTVYQQIPTVGQGKIHIIINGSTRELLAESFDHSAIESFSSVKVVKIIDHEIVQVIKL